MTDQTSARDVAREIAEWWQQYWIHTNHPTEQLRAKITAALQAERARTIEACCEAVCPHCLKGLPLICDSQLRPTIHRGQYDELTCEAAAIRALASATPATDGGLDAAIREAQSQPGIADLERLHKVRS